MRPARLSALLALAVPALLSLGASPAAPPPAPPAAPAPGRQPIRLEPVRLVYRQLEGTYLKGPRGVFVDHARGEVYVADTMNDLVVVYDRDGVAQFAFGYNGEFKEPVKAVTGDRGRIYVLAGVNRRVRVFSYRGEHLEDFPFHGVAQPPVPTALTADERGNLYVADATSGQILVYDADHRLRLRFGTNGDGHGQFKAVQALAVDRQGNIYVADARAIPVQVFGPDGTFLRGWGEHAAGPQNFSLPSGLAIDSEGRVIVVDTLRQAISVFTPDGVFLGRHGGLGFGPGAVAFPTDVAADGGGRIYVVERVGGRLQILEQHAVAGPRPRAAASPAPERVRNDVQRSLTDFLRTTR